MSRETELRVMEWVDWYHGNMNRIPKENLGKRCDFLVLAMDGCLELMIRVCEDLRIAEGRPTSKRLWLPNGMQVTGDVRKFG